MRARALLFTVILTALSHTACVSPTEPDGEDAISQDALEQGKRNVEGFVDIPADMTQEQKDAILAKYTSVEHPGVRQELWERAVIYYDVNLERIPNKRWLAVLDFAKHSKYQRYYLMDMEGGPMQASVVTHGKLSDPDDNGYAQSFSNVSGSNQSSLGYYLTAETYIGGNGRSLRLDGLSTTNSNVRERLVVIHGADYVDEGRAKQGRSLGCPAFPHEMVQPLIDKIMGGSIMYAWN